MIYHKEGGRRQHGPPVARPGDAGGNEPARRTHRHHKALTSTAGDICS
jgi:hypothetical protein